MKQFRFTLEALQRLRQRQEKHALQQYGEAVAEHQEAVRRLEEVNADCEASWALFREHLMDNAPMAYVAQLQGYCSWLEECKRVSARTVEQAQRVCKQRWFKLLLARQAREAVDKLLVRQRERYDRELMREEQMQLDEMANRRFLTPALCNMNDELLRN
ncbi:MAG: flagellar export protein FliJ [Verrucomicrobia bacterium]|nr:flagellar export protein FliJ [Verrucomicrobiota bacterium]